MPVSTLKKRFTYEDYISWAEDERWELINGRVYNMTPAPNLEHQDIAGTIYFSLKIHLKEKPCTAYIAPVDVVLSDSDVVQPDVVVVCDADKLTKNNIQGPPDVVFEILSPTTAKKDRAEKRDLYEHYGVKEYCLVDPQGRFIEKYVLTDTGKYGKSQILDETTHLALHCLPGFTLSIKEIFPKKENSKTEKE